MDAVSKQRGAATGGLAMFGLVLLFVDHRHHPVMTRHVCHHFMMRCRAKIGLYGTRLRDGLKPEGKGGDQPEERRDSSKHTYKVRASEPVDNPD